MLDDLDLTGIQDERARQLIVRLLNLLEDVTADLRDAQEENQRLRDENARLKGEQGKPTIKPNTPKSSPTNHSSERERRKSTPRSKGSKNETVHIDREQVVEVDPAILPPDAEFKGYEEVVVQDVVLRTDNVRFLKEKYYAPSTETTYLAALPRGYDGQFGPGIKALTLTLYFGGQMSEPKILELFGSVGVQISEGQLSNLLIKDQDAFHAEKDAVYKAGLRSSPWQHLDETSTRVNGQNQHCHIVCNPLYTAYHTTESKDRLSVVDVLRNGQPRTFRLNAEALGYLEQVGLSAVTRQTLSRLPPDQDLDEMSLRQWLDEHLPKLGPQQGKWILDAMAVAAYHAQVEFPVVRLLVCDDAPQFNWVTEDLALCWVHEGRHYKKLTPYVPLHRTLLDDFLKRFWAFYDELLVYRQQPTAEEGTRLAAEFDGLFSTVTHYTALDERIAKTKAKKECLLMVLEHPEIPLHNNPAELGARMRVRKRDVSFGPRTVDGVKAWDTFMTLAATAKKLGVSFYHYIHDRVSGANRMLALASLIEAQAKDLNLGASWNTS
jgi:regulator of replication initiation timing